MEWRHTEHDLLRAMNSCLPTDIVVRTLSLASVEFDPRRSACWRGYQYKIYNSPIRSPLQMRRSWHVKAELDLEGMRKFINATTLEFLSLEGLYKSMGYEKRNSSYPQFTDHCFTGEYPVEPVDANSKDFMDKKISLMSSKS